MKINEEDVLKDVLGTFDGERFRGEDGRLYPIPPNYASKSELVEGDVLRLIIENSGSFIYKQVKLVDRKNLIGKVHFKKDEAFVIADDIYYKILPASISFMKAEEGDEAIILVPVGRISGYASLKAIIQKAREEGELSG